MGRNSSDYAWPEVWGWQLALSLVAITFFQEGRTLYDQAKNSILGRQESPPRSETCLDHVNSFEGDLHGNLEFGILNHAAGYLFANKKFEQDKKELVGEMNNALR